MRLFLIKLLCIISINSLLYASQRTENQNCVITVLKKIVYIPRSYSSYTMKRSLYSSSCSTGSKVDIVFIEKIKKV